MTAASPRANGDRLGELRSRLTLPLICAPMFLVSGPDLVIAACRKRLRREYAQALSLPGFSSKPDASSHG